MKKISIAYIIFALCAVGCQKSDLKKVQDLNEPSFDALNSELGIISYAKGFYKVGFGDQSIETLDDGLGFGLLNIVLAFHEGMGDNIFVPWGNNSYKFADNPLSVKLDNGTVVPNPIGQGQQHELQLRNSRAYGPSNSFLPEWTYCYFLNNSSNVLLSKVDGTTFTGDAATKRNLLKAWAYWWKGYAYCRLGSMYLAGVITSAPNVTNGNFVDNSAMVTEGLKDLDSANTLLGSLASGGDYDATLSQIMPNMLKVPHLPSPAEWKRNIATFEARTVLVNKRLKDMTAADYATVLNYVNAGIQASDYVFGIRTNGDNSISVFDKDFGSMEGNLAGEGNTYFVSERSIQDFKSGDKRLDNNFAPLSSNVINKRGRSITFGTRWQLVSGGNGNGAFVYFDQAYGADNFYIGATYEENLLMKAECLIQTSQIDQGLTIIDQVRTLQGAGLPAVSGTGLTLTQALEELRKERRCALLYRGLAFYDLRRWGYTDDVSKGGGRTGCVVLDGSGNLNTNATINYSYMSYWDVPQNELDFNAPTNKTTVLKNPS
jgi:hypothetical protein